MALLREVDPHEASGGRLGERGRGRLAVVSLQRNVDVGRIGLRRERRLPEVSGELNHLDEVRLRRLERDRSVAVLLLTARVRLAIRLRSYFKN